MSATTRVETHTDVLSVQDAMARLPDEQRIAIGLVLVEGLSYKEAAEIMGVPVGTLTSRLARGREALQAHACRYDRSTAMTFSEETLMAYADNELDAQTRTAVEEAMASDPEIARRVAQHKALRGKLRVAFDKCSMSPRRNDWSTPRAACPRSAVKAT
jgi:transposase